MSDDPAALVGMAVSDPDISMQEEYARILPDAESVKTMQRLNKEWIPVESKNGVFRAKA